MDWFDNVIVFFLLLVVLCVICGFLSSVSVDYITGLKICIEDLIYKGIL